MTKEKKYTIKPADEKDLGWVDSAYSLLESYSSEGKLLPYSKDFLHSLAVQNRLVLALDSENTVVGTAAITREYKAVQEVSSNINTDSVVLEFGAWAVQEDWFGSGVGTSLFIGLCHLLEDNNQHYDQMIALSKSEGADVFIKWNAPRIKPFPSNQKILEPCHTCLVHKMKELPEGAACCNQVYDVTSKAREVLVK